MMMGLISNNNKTVHKWDLLLGGLVQLDLVKTQELVIDLFCQCCEEMKAG